MTVEAHRSSAETERPRGTGTAPVRWLAAIACTAFALRVAVSYRAVLGQEFVSFTESDAWYHMRLVDALVRDFPFRLWHDPYLLHPGGEAVNAGPMLDWIIAATALIVGAGAPSSRLIDLAGAFMPPVIGALTIIPIYLLGAGLFSRRAGLWGAFIAAVIPGSYLARSSLGFADHHCLEVLFTTTTLAFVVRATSRPRHSPRRRWDSVVAGCALAAYLLTWGGAALFIAALAIWAGLETLLSRGRDEEMAWQPLLVVFGIAGLATLPWLGTRPFFAYDLLALAGTLLGLVVLRAIVRRVSASTLAYLGIGGGAAMALVVATGLVASPSLLSGLLGEMRRLSPWRGGNFVLEAMPLMRSAQWRPIPLWNELTTALPLSLFAMWYRFDLRSPGSRLFFFWAAVSLAATFGQVRFVYYLAPCVAVLAGRGCELLLAYVATFRRLAASATRTRAERVRTAALSVAVAAGLVAALVGPGVPDLLRRGRASAPLGADWYDALQWMRSNTPEPFADEDAYFSRRAVGPAAYGVMSWWDNGYWITRVARRVPITNPRQSGVRPAADFFLETDPVAAGNALRQLGARYVVADALLQMSVSRVPTAAGFMRSIAVVARRSGNRYCEPMIPLPAEGSEPLLFCYPEYYTTMAVRLYAFGGRAVTQVRPFVIQVRRDSGALPRVEREWSFSTYEEAVRFAAEQPSARRVVGKDPLESCVPLEALDGFVRRFASVGRQSAGRRGAGPSAVQVYEYLPSAAPATER